MGKRIEVDQYRYPPKKDHATTASAVEEALEALEAYKASERAKVLARVRRHRAKKRGVK